jgi:hypothetical protein
MYNNDTPPSTLLRLAELAKVFQPLTPTPGKPTLWFVQPSPGDGITILHDQEGMCQLRTVKLSLRGRGCIPFHRHLHKEKLCIVQPQSMPFAAYLSVIDRDTGIMTTNRLLPEQTHVVPKDHWHMIWTTSDHEIHDLLLVVSSTQDTKDIEWSPTTALLVDLSKKSANDPGGDTPLQLPFEELAAGFRDTDDA